MTIRTRSPWLTDDGPCYPAALTVLPVYVTFIAGDVSSDEIVSHDAIQTASGYSYVVIDSTGDAPTIGKTADEAIAEGFRASVVDVVAGQLTVRGCVDTPTSGDVKIRLAIINGGT